MRGDVIQLLGFDGEVDKTYDYDAYGNEYARDLADENPFRYCGEYYDTETGFIYLRARYYDPMVGRFTSVDPIKDGLNWYAYCENDPVNFVDHFGLRAKELERKSGTEFERVAVDYNLKSNKVIKYDVPLYDQNGYKLCWAFCQIMLEDYQTNTTRTNDEATEKAIELAISVNEATDISEKKKWNQANWPVNLGDKIDSDSINGIDELYSMLLYNGPVFAYYCGVGKRGDKDYVSPHIVVVTGVNVIDNVVYTNNSHGVYGTQSYEEFIMEYAGMTKNPKRKLTRYYFVKKIGEY